MKSKKNTIHRYPNFFVIGLLVIVAFTATVKAEEKPQTINEPTKQGELAKATSVESEPKVVAESQLTPREVPASSSESQPSSQPVDSKAAPQPAEQAPATAAGEPTSEQAGAEAKRKGRAEAAAAPSSSESSKSQETKSTSAEKPVEKPAGEKAKSEPTKASPKAKQTPKPASKSKLPANLGTVTSTGSGGPAHYLSKHDAYSAIAEKHGALSHESTRKADHQQKRGSSSHLQAFGIQKAGGISDLLSSPFKGVTDNGLARTLGASMRSIMKGKYSVPAYVASALLGAVALMAFYESPISPLPVPPLPEPPVGRFPPEMPVISPNTQVPFRGNNQGYAQQGYQRSSSILPSYNPIQQQAQQQAQQVLFPGNAQQRSGQVNLAAPVQQLAANLLSVGKQQVAQRKSSPDYDQQSLSRSFFGQTQTGPTPKMGSSSGPQKQGSSILGFFGLGGGSASSPASSSPSSASPTVSGDQQVGSPSQPANTPLDLKNQPGQQNGGPGLSSSGPGLSNSHLVNKFKSYFSRAGGSAAQTGATSGSSSNGNPYDQYQRMSLIQALMKDTAFLPAFLSPTRKSSSVGTTASAAATKPASRMQIDSTSASLPVASKQAANQRTSSGYGLVRTAQALLETLTSSIAQRSATTQSHDQSEGASVRKSLNDDGQANLLASATSSLLSDIMSSYNAANSEQMEQAKSLVNGNNQHASGSSASTSEQSGPNARSASDSSSVHDQTSAQDQKSSTGEQQQPQQQASLSRKTRSIGFEYPNESNQELSIREQQPSKAAQINNVIDFVADSYTHNRLLFNFVMNQVGLSQAVPYVEQILAPKGGDHHH